MHDLASFITRWKASGASERSNYQLFLTELCEVLGVEKPQPASDTTAENDYVFERAVTQTSSDGAGSSVTGFIDLYKRGCFVLEAKQGRDAPEPTEAEQLGGAKLKQRMGTAKRGTPAWSMAMRRAKTQAQRYARMLPTEHGWPPFLVVVDVGYCIDLYADFSGLGKLYTQFPNAQSYRITLDDLTREDVRMLLRAVWTDPASLDPASRSARVTRVLAARLGKLATSLEKSDHLPEAVAHFLMRCLFSMFAEDVGLLPDRSFTKLLMRYRDPERIHLFPQALESLWNVMDTGGFAPGLDAEIIQFNGVLFHEPSALPLTPAQLDLLIEAAEAEWRDVEPAIFGTLLERALDPRERHKLGAHFTPRAYVERLVMPTVVEPLREKWQAAQAAAAALEANGDEQGARKEIASFHRQLCSTRILDPACGSGNFLYVTLEHLKRLEGEVLEALKSYGGQQTLDMTGGYTVAPNQFLGLEINPRAAAIADIVLWIGYLQWHFRTHGHAKRLDPPILREYKNIQYRDALIEYDARVPRLDKEGNAVTRWDGITRTPHPITGQLVPDENARTPVFDYVNPREAEWPSTDFIVGNPPFIGTAFMRSALGDGYTEAVRKVYAGDVPDSADFVTYWWHKAAELVRHGKAERFGFITTNSLRQTFNRRVIERHLDADPPLSIAFAVPDHPWVDSELGADVRIAMTVGISGERAGRLAEVVSEEKSDAQGRNVELEERRGRVHADLTTGVNVTVAIPLEANQGVSNRGFELGGAGFIVSEDDAQKLGLYSDPRISEIIRPYRHGRDLLQRPRGVYVIDLYGLTQDHVRVQYPRIYQWLLERVKPEREQNRSKTLREKWWLHRRLREDLRDSLSGLLRFIVTVETAKHRIFQFLDRSIVPDNMLIAIASDDAFHLGVLSSRIHVTWALAAGGRLGVGNDPRYNKTRCFEPFPFPAATEDQKERIRTIAEALDAHRCRQLVQHDKLTMTGMYNVLEKLRTGETRSSAEKKSHEQGLVSVLRDLHDDLDRAVVDAYGWPVDLTDEQILERVVALNKQRAAEEERGIVRYLRPEYQNPEAAAQAALEIESATTAASADIAEKRPWPKERVLQAQVIQEVLQSEGPGTIEQVAGRFTRANRKLVAEWLEILESLGQVRREERAYHV